MADCGHHRGACGCDGALQRLLRKRQQVFYGAAAAGDDDHVHLRIRIEALESRNDLRHGARALDCGVDHLEAHRRPTILRHRKHVALRGGPAAGDQPHLVRQVGQAALVLRIKEALSRQAVAQLLDARQQLTHAHVPDLRDLHGEGTPLREEVWFAVDDDMVAVVKRGAHAAQQPGVSDELHRCLSLRIAQCEVGIAPVGLGLYLGELAFDPKVAQALNPALDAGVEFGDAPRRLRSTFWRLRPMWLCHEKTSNSAPQGPIRSLGTTSVRGSPLCN